MCLYYILMLKVIKKSDMAWTVNEIEFEHSYGCTLQSIYELFAYKYSIFLHISISEGKWALWRCTRDFFYLNT